MARGWYGLYLGDRVVYEEIEGTIVKLFALDKNKGLLLDDTGNEHTIVCEYCTKIPPKDGLLTFRPLSDIQYTVLLYNTDDFLDVYSFTGDEIEDKVMRIVTNAGNEIEKIAVYVRETASNLNSLY
ncbi:hypothetical protein C8Z91_22475 [Paenibacillus elgii]|uniref:Uncharacterized protein n=1 Tax=Paenibacillus elgii TaxID=189691 RepID=A0A2T6FYB7_9BACL|nr:hypothetical protein [Paenibacillus elgii]PUA36917.1 hypothetical protein C8Z91_22475 [Paenibacillus elgii]